MSQNEALVSRISLKLDGDPVQRPLLDEVLEVTVEQSAHVPDMFTVRLYNPQLELLDEGPFQLTREIEIAAEDSQGEEHTLMTGEITALEPVFGEGMISELVVRGYDKSHRFYRESKSRAFLNKKDSDLATEIAREHGLKAEVDTTSTVYDHIFQHNESDLAFLMRRAWRIGFECFVDGETLHFRLPPEGGADATVRWGEDLLTFRPRVTLAEQVNEVVVRGWDAINQKPIVGRAENGNLSPQIAEEKDGPEWASTFGKGKVVIVDQPVSSQSEADVLAAARMDELSGAFIQAQGTAFRRPDIQAGRIIELEALGERLSGSYLVTSATHVYNSKGLETRFDVRGARGGTILEHVNGQAPERRWPGVVVGIVTNSDDPEGWGRVKVKFPWMTEDAESDWARVIGPGAGPDAGLFIMPEVDDEVLVAFEHGDFNRPVVLGGVWNGQYAPPPAAADAPQGEKPLVRSWRSRTGHTITVYDNADNRVEIATAGGQTVNLDDAQKKIEIKSGGGITITIDDNAGKITVEGSRDVDVSSANNINVKAGANMKLEAGANVDIQASGQVNVKGAMINLN